MSGLLNCSHTANNRPVARPWTGGVRGGGDPKLLMGGGGGGGGSCLPYNSNLRIYARAYIARKPIFMQHGMLNLGGLNDDLCILL